MKTLRWLLAVGLSVSAAFADWKKGDKVEILWGGRWYPGTVVEVDGAKTKVGYDGYASSWDEWAAPERLRAVGAEQTAATAKAESAGAATAVPAPVSGAWKTGDRVEAYSSGKWYPGKIVEAEAARWKVTYDGYSSRWDEWLGADRIRAPGAAADPEAKSFAWPARPEGAKGGLQGAWLRTETFYWSGSLSLSNHGWFFTKNGRFSRAPAGGFDFNAFEKAEKAGGLDGVYWITGDKLILRWADGSKDLEYDFERKGDELKFGGIGAVPVQGFKKGWRLDGEYEGGASFGGGAIASSNTLVFRKDGTFARSSVGSFVSRGDTTSVSGGSQSESAGTYEFNGYTLTLKLTDGSTVSHTVLAFGDKDGAGRPEYIYRDGTMMRNQEMKRASK